jgi:hypothetical protein
MNNLIKKPLFWIALAGVLAAGIGCSFLVYKYHSTLLSFVTPVKPPVLGSTTTNSGQLTPDQTKAIVAEVGKLIDLPTGEEPTVATITDASKLASQEFFKHAQNGDQVLIYTNAKKAYLYSTSLKKILDVEPISVGSASPSATPSETIPTPTTSKRIPSPTKSPTPTPSPSPQPTP